MDESELDLYGDLDEFGANEKQQKQVKRIPNF